MNKLVITVTTSSEYDPEANVTIEFDPPVKTDESKKPSTVELYGAFILKSIAGISEDEEEDEE